ncbi:MAG TPA: GAF domain-containing protein, partial [Candidatus Limnocylindrales bacterium]|nr:GAF domain-containing protein [Candidatus Limnocylindrales bacterium]
MAQSSIDDAPVQPLPVAPAAIELDDLRSVLEGVTAGLSVQDDTGRLIYVNADAARLSGFDSPAAMLAASPAELRARFELIDEAGEPLSFEALPGRRALAGDPGDPVIIGFRLEHGEERWSIVRARAMVLAGGRRIAVNTFIDITARIELEQRLRASERRTQELAEERQRASELARMMADAALRLDEAEGTDAVVQAAAESAVPVLADWCVVDLLDPDGTLRRVGMAARDPALAAAIEPLRDHPAVRAPARASRRAVSEGAPVIALDIEAWYAADPAPDPEHRRILTESGLRNAIAQPLVARGRTIGAIVFATVGDRTFDDPAIAASAEMASRVGVSIANSQAHEAAQAARRDAEAVAERERFLARATSVLTSSLDYERTVQAVADLVVPEFADWCVVHVPGDFGVPRRIAVAHRDPDKVALAIRAQEEYPADPSSETGTAAILRTGRSEFMADIPPELVDAAARDDRHREMLRALSLRSYISVPMMVSGRVIGVLTLVGSEGSHRFVQADVAFAEALAARAAAAIETARLFREGVRFKRLLDA